MNVLSWFPFQKSDGSAYKPEIQHVEAPREFDFRPYEKWVMLFVFIAIFCFLFLIFRDIVFVRAQNHALPDDRFCALMRAHNRSYKND